MSHRRTRAAAAAAALAGVVVLTAGCRTVRPPEGTVHHEPLYDRGEVRGELQRARRIAELAEGVERAVADAGVELWESFEALYAAPPQDPAAAREREAAIVSRYLRAVEAAARERPGEDPDPRPGEDPAEGKTVVELQFEHYYRAVSRAQAEGRFTEAIAAAEALLDDIEAARGEGAAPSGTQLRLWIGLWQLATGDYAGARSSFEEVQALRDEGAELAERARLLVEELDLLQTLPPGPDRDDLARGWAMVEIGDLELAGALARTVQQRSGDADVQREASFLLAAVQRSQAAWIDDLERRARADIADGPPFEIALASAEALDGGVEPAPARAREVRAAVDEAEAGLAAMASATLAEQWSAAAEEARALVAAERFREAVALYDRFQGTELEERARGEQVRTADILVREERRRAGDLFVAAQSEADPARRTALLAEARAILAGLLEEFPDSSYTDRVRRNLEAVDEALGADPG